jgi:protein disulfide-isomerase A6
MKGIVNIAAVDATVSENLASQYQVQGFPTIKVFGNDKKDPYDYQGKRTASDIVDGALSAARKATKARMGGNKKEKKEKKSSSTGGGGSGGDSAAVGDVVTLTDGNFQELVIEGSDNWMIEFYAPWCGHCKALAPEWSAAATELKGMVKVGDVDATVQEQLAQQYGVKGYPTIFSYFGGKAEPYQGGRTTGDIVNYALEMLEKLGGWEPTIPQVVSQESLDEVCSPTKGTCILGFLPHILDSGKAGREEYVSTMISLVKKSRGAPLSFGWVEAGSQPAIEALFGMTFGFPAAIALKRDKQMTVLHRGAFTDDALRSFSMKRHVWVDYADFPKMDTAELWDGEEAKLEEEEFSLDDIMGED